MSAWLDKVEGKAVSGPWSGIFEILLVGRGCGSGDVGTIRYNIEPENARRLLAELDRVAGELVKAIAHHHLTRPAELEPRQEEDEAGLLVGDYPALRQDQNVDTAIYLDRKEVAA